MKVYWIHTSEQTDISTEGYVGITRRCIEERRSEHGDRFPEEAFVEEIFEGSEEECFKKESGLRPEPKIGWNLAPGGKKHGWRDTGVRTKHAFRTKEHNQKISESRKGHKYDEAFSARSKETGGLASAGTVWVNNGSISKRVRGKIPDGFVKGRLNKRKEFV